VAGTNTVSAKVVARQAAILQDAAPANAEKGLLQCLKEAI